MVEGDSVDIEDYSYQVSLRITKTAGSLPTHSCGGTIIDENHIVTAAHCFAGFDYKSDLVYAKVEDLKIYAGTSTLDNQGSVYDVASYTNHPQYNTTNYNNDIAVVKLSKPIEFSDTQKAIELPSSPIKSGMTGIVTGWGDTRSIYRYSPATVLQKTTLILMDFKKREERAQEVGVDPGIIDTHICGYNPNRKGSKRRGRYPGVCVDDSGGPLVVDNKLVGVMSHGYAPVCGEGDPNIFASVYALLDFIKEKTAN